MACFGAFSPIFFSLPQEEEKMKQVLNALNISDFISKIVQIIYIYVFISRHTIVCRAALEAGAPHREYIDRKNENVIFTPLYLGDHLSDWNQICYTVARQPRESTFQI